MLRETQHAGNGPRLRLSTALLPGGACVVCAVAHVPSSLGLTVMYFFQERHCITFYLFTQSRLFCASPLHCERIPVATLNAGGDMCPAAMRGSYTYLEEEIKDAS